MAGDATFAPLLLALGLTEFSLHPATLLELRRAIRDCDLGALRARAPALLRARDRAGIEAWLHAQTVRTLSAAEPHDTATDSRAAAAA